MEERWKGLYKEQNLPASDSYMRRSLLDRDARRGTFHMVK